MTPLALRRLSREEQGFALPVTLGVLSVVVILVATLAVASISVTRQTRRDVGWLSALGAAEAGVQDFLYRINLDPEYWRRTPTNADGTANAGVDAANAAFTSFVAVPGAANQARFTYSVDQRVQAEGAITVVSTGRVGDVSRTIRTVLRKESFLNYAYMSDYEARDPAMYETWPLREEDNLLNDRDRQLPADTVWGSAAVARAHAECGRYGYATPGRSPDCYEIFWNENDTFDGPFHTNDRIIYGTWLTPDPDVWRVVPSTTSWGDGGQPPSVPDPGFLDVNREVNGQWWTDNRPRFPYPSLGSPPRWKPRWRQPLRIPPSNTTIRDTAQANGYVFTGPTRVVLLNDGTIYVDSPGSNVRRVMQPPPNGVIYVQEAPASDCTGFRPPLGAGGPPAAQNYLEEMYAGANPAAWDITKYSCSRGDAYVEGELLGRLTIATAHDIFVTWHIGYASSPENSGTASGYRLPPAAPTSDRDLLGLVAGGGIRLFRPTTCVNWLVVNGVTTDVCNHGFPILFHQGSPSGTIRDLTVYGALLAGQGSVRLENHVYGGRLGELHFYGAVAQRYRGDYGVYSGAVLPLGAPGMPAAGTSCSASYLDNDGRTVGTLDDAGGGNCATAISMTKHFSYDQRLAYLEPPSFLEPEAVSYGVTRFEEHPTPADHRTRS